jgi:hypothetical protein
VTLSLLGCTLAENVARVATEGGGLLAGSPDPTAATVVNSIFWGNRAHGEGGQAAQLVGPPGAIAIDWSDVEGWDGGLGGTGNIGADPLFADPPLRDYHLQPGSPCIDSADPGFSPAPGHERDLEGNVRRLDGDFDLAEILDMGALEFAHVRLSILGQPTPDGIVTVITRGTPGLPAVLVAGVGQGIVPIEPFGLFFIDVFQPVVFVPWPAAPSEVEIEIPLDLPVPEDYFVQVFAGELPAGNLSNLVHVRVE